MPPAELNHFENGCNYSANSVRLAAIQDEHEAVAKLSSSDGKEGTDIACVRHRVAMLKNQNTFSAAELLDVQHRCDACHRSSAASSALQTSPMFLATNILRDRHEKEMKIRGIMQQVAHRNFLIQRFEHHLKTYDEIRKNLKIEVVGDNIDHFFKIDHQSGLSLVIQPRNNGNGSGTEPKSQLNVKIDNNIGTTSKSVNPTNLVDVATLPPIVTPVLTPAPAQAGPSSAAPAQAPATPPQASAQPAEFNERWYTGSPLQLIPAKRKHSTPPVLGIWDSEEERAEALRNQASMFTHHNADNAPLIFTHGIQYTPPSPRLPNDAYRSRMVVFERLEADMTWFDVVSCVRGGLVHRVARAVDSPVRSMAVYFVHGRDAHYYKEYVYESLGCRLRINGVGDGAVVDIVETPSYPMREDLMREIMENGVTRCLAIPDYSGGSGRLLEALFERKKIRDYVIVEEEEKRSSVRQRDEESEEDEDSDEDSDADSGIDDVGTPAPTPITTTAPITTNANVNVNAMSSTTATPSTTTTGTTNTSTIPSRPATLDADLVEEWFNPDDQNLPPPSNPPSSSSSANHTPIAAIIHFRDIMFAQNAYREILKAFPYCGVRYAADPCAGPLHEIDEMELDDWSDLVEDRAAMMAAANATAAA